HAADPVRPVPQRGASQRQGARARPRPVHLARDRRRASRYADGAVQTRGRHVLRGRAAEERGTESMTILIVEDEIHGGETLRDVLEDEGYRVSLARDGHEALTQLAAQGVSLVILDLRMPGMNGTALYDEMQRSPELAKIPVLVTTSDPTRA